MNPPVALSFDIMTLAFEFQLDNAKMNQQTKYLDQGLRRLKVIIRADRQAHTTDRLVYPDHKHTEWSVTTLLGLGR